MLIKPFKSAACELCFSQKDVSRSLKWRDYQISCMAIIKAYFKFHSWYCILNTRQRQFPVEVIFLCEPCPLLFFFIIVLLFPSLSWPERPSLWRKRPARECGGRQRERAAAQPIKHHSVYKWQPSEQREPRPLGPVLLLWFYPSLRNNKTTIRAMSLFKVPL